MPVRGVLVSLTRMVLLYIACLIALPVPGRAAAAQEVPVYDYHLKPPFLLDTDATRGLDADLVAYLNRKGGPFRFVLHYVPRNRLNRMIEHKLLDGLVVGVNPVWFGDRDEQRYFWSPSYLTDEDIVVSRKAQPVEYRKPESLLGLRVGLPAGFYYAGISELAAAGKLVREDGRNEETNLRKLAAGRLDVTIVSRSTYTYLLARYPEWREELFVAAHPEDRFERRFLIPRSMGRVHAHLQKVLMDVGRDPEWQRILGRYQLKP